MGREIHRVPMDFSFPLGESYFDSQWNKHKFQCTATDCAKCCVDTQPPAGDGWQLWQTVSDGPISPVFASAEQLIDWMCQPVPPEHPTYNRSGGGAYPTLPWAQGYTREHAERLVRAQWEPSFTFSSKHT